MSRSNHYSLFHHVSSLCPEGEQVWITLLLINNKSRLAVISCCSAACETEPESKKPRTRHCCPQLYLPIRFILIILCQQFLHFFLFFRLIFLHWNIKMSLKASQHFAKCKCEHWFQVPIGPEMWRKQLFTIETWPWGKTFPTELSRFVVNVSTNDYLGSTNVKLNVEF